MAGITNTDNTIADKLNDLVTAKERMKNAIIRKGVRPEGGLSTYAHAIDAIDENNNLYFPYGTKFAGSEFRPALKYIGNNLHSVRLPEVVEDYLDNTTLTDWSYMFANCYFYPNGSTGVINIMPIIPVFDTSHVTNMAHMFENVTVAYSFSDGDQWIPRFDTSNVTDMSYMFCDTRQINKKVPPFNTSKVKYMQGMFKSSEIDLDESYPTDSSCGLEIAPTFDTSSVLNMSKMFCNCTTLTNVPQFDTSNVTDMSYMFYYCKSMVGAVDFDISNAVDLQYMFYLCGGITDVTLRNAHNVIAVDKMFKYYTTNNRDWSTNLKTVTITDMNSVIDMNRMFYYQDKLTSVALTNLYSATNTSYMFSKCSSLTDAIVSGARNLTNAGYMFQDCKLLESVTITNTSNLTDANNMFNGCTSLATPPDLDTSNLTDANNMFNGCTSLVTVPLFDTSNVTNASGMFYNCTSLESVTMTDTSNVTDMSYMFCGCYALATVPDLDTSNVTDMHNMFQSCRSLVSVPRLNAGNVTGVDEIFYGCDNLTDIGGLVDLGKQNKCGYTSDGGTRWHVKPFGRNPKNQISKESVLNIFNNLYDRSTGDYYYITIELGTQNTILLTDEEIAIVTNKGWTLY